MDGITLPVAGIAATSPTPHGGGGGTPPSLPPQALAQAGWQRRALETRCPSAAPSRRWLWYPIRDAHSLSPQQILATHSKSRPVSSAARPEALDPRIERLCRREGGTELQWREGTNLSGERAPI